MRTTTSAKLVYTLVAWSVTAIVFFPIVWMTFAAFKTEIEAVATPPSFIFSPTLENFFNVNQRADYFKFAFNSVYVSLGGTLIALLLSVPAAYAMAFYPGRRTKDLLMWMLSTKMMPAVGVLVPTYLLFRDTNLLDTLTGLVIVYTLSNLPIVVWMLYSFFREVPREILEAAVMDGAAPRAQLIYLLVPLTAPGIASTSLLSIILCWNEAFWSINLTATKAPPLTAFIASFSSPEGLFWAKLSAASLMAIAPVMIFGWLTQRQLVRGLTFGAVK
jgi:sorbitol/mannitol transport system permease protein